VNGVPKATINLWIVPAKVAGRWHVQLDGGEAYDVTLKQSYQLLEGAASTQGKSLKIASGRVRGEEIVFTLSDGSARRQFRGRVSGDGIQGTADLGAGRSSRWTARRA